MKENEVVYLVGNKSAAVNVFEPYSELVIDFLNDLSLNLLRIKEFSDVVSLGYYCRKANIKKLKAQYEDGKVRLGRGVVFHVTPSNVPINFAFSYIFGLLAGCCNIVRVPSKNYPQTAIVCNAIKNVFLDEKYSLIANSTQIISYQVSEEITTMFSNIANARIIWGGDNTVANIKRLPSSSRCVDIAFSDRYSFMVVDSNKIIGANSEELKSLAKRFYNDTYFIDQNACSSPHLLVWYGENVETAKKIFWQNVFNIAEQYVLEPIKVIDKYTLLLANAINFSEIKAASMLANLIYRVELSSLPQNMEKCRGKFGLFYEYESKNLNEIASFVTNKCQTITYYGDIKEKLLAVVVNNKIVGIDRIVPVGQALSIDVIWDGYDIVKTLSRIISIN